MSLSIVLMKPYIDCKYYFGQTYDILVNRKYRRYQNGTHSKY